MTSTQTKNRLKRTRGADHVDQPPKLVPAAKRRRGRPEIEVLPEMVRVACAMAKVGATDVEMAAELGISERTFYVLVARNPEFSQAVREGKEFADDRVQNSMFRVANGFTVKTEKVFANGLRVAVDEYLPPNPAAQMNWLRNRRNWRSGDNVVQDAIDAAANADPDAPVSTKTLAMAALALLTGAAMAPASQPNTIDVTPNAPRAMDDDPNEEPDDEENFDTPYLDDRDPDFDFD